MASPFRAVVGFLSDEVGSPRKKRFIPASIVDTGDLGITLSVMVVGEKMKTGDGVETHARQQEFEEPKI
jgi:hypothetical protein